MRSGTLRAFAFGSFVKLGAMIFASGGLAAGFAMFVVSLFGANVYLHFDRFVLTGIAAGAAAIPTMPLLMSLFGTIFGVVAFLPFKLLLRIIGGLTLNEEWSVSGSSMNSGVHSRRLAV